MPMGICRLCQVNSELQCSHIVPAFVYRWLRDSSGNGFIRNTNTPNRRVQDGPQEHLLCIECEAQFNRAETAFANQLFHPYLKSSGQKFRYSEWLLYFCVSISWRVLQLHKLKDNNEGLESWKIEAIDKAELAWRTYLQRKAPHPGPYRQHILPFDEVSNFTGELPPNFNRYLLRAIQIDLCHNDETIFTFSKLGRFVVLGFISQPYPAYWSGSRINANIGIIEPRAYSLPGSFREYLVNQANSVSSAMVTISNRQRLKIDDTLLSNVERIRGSDFFTAMSADVNLFGDDAFKRNT